MKSTTSRDNTLSKKTVLTGLAFALTIVLFSFSDVGAWPFGMGSGGSNSDGYFTGASVTATGPAVLPPNNHSGTNCGTYTSGRWASDGSRNNSASFAIPNSAVPSNGSSTSSERKDALYNFLRTTYNDGSATGNCLETQKRYGAAFIVHTLLGRDSSQVSSPTVSSSDWNELRSRLDNPNLWLGTNNSFSRSENSNAVRGRQLSGAGGSTDSIRDVSYRDDSISEPTLLFRDGDSTGNIFYALKRRCGNPTGKLPGIEPAFRVTGQRIGPSHVASGQRVRVQQDRSGSNYDQSDTSGMSFNFTEVPRPSDVIRVTAYNTNNDISRMRMESRACASPETNCTSWSSTSWTSSSTISQDRGRSLNGRPIFEVRVYYEAYVEVRGERMPGDDSVTASDVAGHNVRVRQPASGSNFNQVDNTGNSFEFENVPFGPIRLAASNAAGYQMSMRYRECTGQSRCGGWVGSPNDWDVNSLANYALRDVTPADTTTLIEVQVYYRFDVTGLCPSYSPYSSFNEFSPVLNLPPGGQPSEHQDSVRGNTISEGSVSTSTSWWVTQFSSDTLRTQRRTRSYSQQRTGDRWAYYYVYNNTTRINSVRDEHGQATNYTGGNDGQIRLDYSVHYDSYPYDTHTPVVDYNSEYDQRRFNQTGTSSRSTTRSIFRTQTREEILDDDGEFVRWGPWVTRSEGSFPSNRNAVISSVGWGPWFGFSGNRNLFTTTNQVWGSPSQQVSGPSMPPCYPRQYAATVSIDNGFPRLRPTRENPNRSELEATVTVRFRAVDGPRTHAAIVREASRINNLEWSALSWTLRSGDSEGAPIDPNDSSDPRTQGHSGSVNISAVNARRISSGGSGDDIEVQYSVVVASEDHNNPPNIAAGDRVCWIIDIGNDSQFDANNSNQELKGWVGSSRNDARGLILSQGSGYGSSGYSRDDGCTPEVHDQPYVSVFGADVVAGQGVGRDERCESGNTGSFIAANFDSSNSRGAGVQFAAQAMSQINGFSTAKMRTSSPSPLTGLAFANTTNDGAAMPGSMLNHYCGIDYIDRMPIEEGIAAFTPPSDNQTLREVFQQGSNSVALRYDGPDNLTLSIPPGLADNPGDPQASQHQLANGQRRTLYVTGQDVLIRSNIVYQSYDWEDVADIPSFNLIVDGSIYIHPDVTELDGIYFATGDIYTCANNINNPVSLSRAFEDCQSPLQVNGALSANRIVFNRYADSSLRAGLRGEFPTRSNTERSCLDVSEDRRICAAETINFSPEAYLVEPVLPPSTVPGQSQYESITSLPPIL